MIAEYWRPQKVVHNVFNWHLRYPNIENPFLTTLCGRFVYLRIPYRSRRDPLAITSYLEIADCGRCNWVAGYAEKHLWIFNGVTDFREDIMGSFIFLVEQERLYDEYRNKGLTIPLYRATKKQFCKNHPNDKRRCGTNGTM